MKLSDALIRWCVEHQITTGFGLQGGAAAHIFDSAAAHHEFRCHYFHHEQHAAQAAIGYTKYSGKPSVVIVTTGPGGTNALTPLLASWQDSVPVLFISGQARLEQTSYGTGLRQLGSQEAPILELVKPITKLSSLVSEPNEIIEILNKSYIEMTGGRPGPVWIDIPVNLTWADVEYYNHEFNQNLSGRGDQSGNHEISKIAAEFSTAKKPLILVGGGARASGINRFVVAYAEEKRVPVVMTWLGTDIVDTDSPICGGTIGMFGQRGANELMFDSDYILCLGANLSPTQTGSARSPYCPNAKIVSITNDKRQAASSRAKYHKLLEIDLELFWSKFKKQIANKHIEYYEIQDKKEKNYIGKLDIRKSAAGNEQLFAPRVVYAITEKIDGHIVIDGGGTALYAGFQAAYRHKNRRVICSTAVSSMGTALSEAGGLLAANVDGPVTVVIGDGSFHMCSNALAKLNKPAVPLTIIVINNDGYLAIRHTQRDFLSQRYVGVNTDEGLFYPQISDIAHAYQARYTRIRNNFELEQILPELNTTSGLHIVEALVSKDENCLFRQGVTLRLDGPPEVAPLSEMEFN